MNKNLQSALKIPFRHLSRSRTKRRAGPFTRPGSMMGSLRRLLLHLSGLGLAAKAASSFRPTHVASGFVKRAVIAEGRIALDGVDHQLDEPLTVHITRLTTSERIYQLDFRGHDCGACLERGLHLCLEIREAHAAEQFVRRQIRPSLDQLTQLLCG